jgi:Chalcone isomerase-like
MLRSRVLALVLVGLGAAGAVAAELVGVSGSEVQYATPLEASVGGATVKLVLTGTALRTKLFFRVYAIGSYLQEGAAVRTAEELAAADCPKQLHLVMERDLAGTDLAQAFQAAIRLNHAEPAFQQELERLAEALRATSVKRGDRIVLTHVPKVGLRCQVAGNNEMKIDNVDFSRAVWEIYLGKNNIGEAIKRALVSRL